MVSLLVVCFVVISPYKINNNHFWYHSQQFFSLFSRNEKKKEQADRTALDGKLVPSGESGSLMGMAWHG
jgi:hypothetical protein